MEVCLVGLGTQAVKGGIEVHTDRLAHQLSLLGYKVRRLDSVRDAGELRGRTLDWVIFEGVHRVDLVDFFLLRRFSASHAAIFTHGSFFEAIHARELRQSGYPFDWIPFLEKQALDQFLFPAIINRFDFVFSLSDTESTDLAGRFPSIRERIVALPNFIGSDESSITPERDVVENFRVHYGPYVCAIGRVDARKNFSSVIEAINGTGIGFVLGGKDQGQVSELVKLASRLRDARFTYLGEVNAQTKTNLISGSIGTVLPSYFEGYPFAVIDSLRLGRPAICTSRCYMPSLPGVIPCESSPGSVRQAIQALLTRGSTLSAPVLPTDRDVAELLSKYLGSPF